MADPPVHDVDAHAVATHEVRAKHVLTQHRALALVAAAAIVFLVWISLPVGFGVLVGALFAFTLYTPYRKIAKRTHKPVLYAAIFSALSMLVVAAALFLLLYLLVLRGIQVVQALPAALAPNGALASLLQSLTAPLARFGMKPPALVDELRAAAGQLEGWLAGAAASLVGIVFDGLLAMFFMVITEFVILHHWSAIRRRAERLLPLNPRHTQAMFRMIRRLGRQVLVGTLGTGALQGLFAGIGYAVVGFPQPAFFGAMTAVASLLPAFGTMLVWLPAILYLFFGGHSIAAIILLVWCALVVVFVCDYIIRPKLVGRGDQMGWWATYVSLFGGLKLFGFVGFFVGPILVGVALGALRIWERERQYRLHDA